MRVSLNRKKKLGHFPYVSVLFSIVMALFVVGVFGLLLIYSGELEKQIRRHVKVQVYLRTQVTESQRTQIIKTIESKPYTARAGDEADIRFISKEEAAKKFIRETGEDFQEFIGENPFRDALLVGIDVQHHEPERMREVKSDLEKVAGVYQVSYAENAIASIQKNVRRISLVLAGLAVVLLLTVVLLIHHSLRIALFSQRFLIRSMQLVGATRFFIQKPFLTRAGWHGFLGGAIACLLLSGLIYLANRNVEELQSIENRQSITILFAGIVVLGMVVCVLSTFGAVRRYLRMSLDDLY
jgi:cell division transport system permease protein